MRALICVALVLVACGGRTVDRTDRSTHDGGDDASTDLARPTDLTTAPQAPTACPCALGSYCDHSTNLCVIGCLGSDHCPSTEICDTSAFQCRQACNQPSDCSGHRDCHHLGGSAAQFCVDCVEGYADCNGDPADGCEATLDSLDNCGGCAKPGTSLCVVDHDGDYFGAEGTEVVRCGCSQGYAYAGSLFDCDDADPMVFPGQQQWVTRTSVGGANDFDCDGFVEKIYPYGKTCGASCQGPIWVDDEPTCGEVGEAIHCKYDESDDTCGYSNFTFEVVQACR